MLSTSLPPFLHSVPSILSVHRVDWKVLPLWLVLAHWSPTTKCDPRRSGSRGRSSPKDRHAVKMHFPHCMNVQWDISFLSWCSLSCSGRCLGSDFDEVVLIFKTGSWLVVKHPSLVATRLLVSFTGSVHLELLCSCLRWEPAGGAEQRSTGNVDVCRHGAQVFLLFLLFLSLFFYHSLRGRVCCVFIFCILYRMSSVSAHSNMLMRLQGNIPPPPSKCICTLLHANIQAHAHC